MASRTAIEWTEVTWNPVTGCDRVSAGCDHCYALALAKRLKAMGVARYQSDGDPTDLRAGFRCIATPGGPGRTVRVALTPGCLRELDERSIPRPGTASLRARCLRCDRRYSPAHLSGANQKIAPAAAPGRAPAGGRRICGWVFRSRTPVSSVGSITFARCPQPSGSCPASRCSARWIRSIWKVSAGSSPEASQARTTGRCTWSGRAGCATACQRRGGSLSSSSNGAAGHPRPGPSNSTAKYGTRCQRPRPRNNPGLPPWTASRIPRCRALPSQALHRDHGRVQFKQP